MHKQKIKGKPSNEATRRHPGNQAAAAVMQANPAPAEAIILNPVITAKPSTLSVHNFAADFCSNLKSIDFTELANSHSIIPYPFKISIFILPRFSEKINTLHCSYCDWPSTAPILGGLLKSFPLLSNLIVEIFIPFANAGLFVDKPMLLLARPVNKGSLP